MCRHSMPYFGPSILAALLLALVSGCTSVTDYVHNGFKVGPNYSVPPASAALHWIDAADAPEE